MAARSPRALRYLGTSRAVAQSRCFFFFCVLILLQGLCVTCVPRELSHSPGVFFPPFFPPVSSDCCWISPYTAAMYVLILLLYTSSCYICVLILLLCMSSYCCYACAHTAAIRAHCCYTCALPLSLAVVACICVLMLLHMCPHTAPMYVPVLLLCMCSRCYALLLCVAHRRYLLQVYLEGQGERGNAVSACLLIACLTITACLSDRR